MKDFTPHAALFATPQGAGTLAAVRGLALARLNSTRARIVGALAESHLDLLADSLRDFTPGGATAWRPETGLALLAYRNRQHTFAALQWAAACASMGGRGSMMARLDTPQWLYLDGSLVPLTGECGLIADGDLVVVETNCGSTAFRLTAENRWESVQTKPGPWAVFASGGLAPRYVTATGLRHSVEGFPWISGTVSGSTDSGWPPRSVPARRIANIANGWRTILTHAPLFGGWVADTACGCLLIEPSGTHSAQSGSSYDHPGLIAIEPPECPFFCGEILVHECSHQQLLIYSMVAPLVERGSRETYYSPIKRATRSIDRVLTGAHAVGNMVRYYATVRQSVPLDRASQERFERHHKWFQEDYRPALDASQSLTPAGRLLWTSLCRAVDEAMRQ
ncbi:MAG TPA: HEXXH motif-containing putative peptide modification protein [Bryobacteraceae bacterium]|nr:HEXXH motif-containing putative peptide modification protein [Bryobacteraceae bacterium]